MPKDFPESSQIHVTKVVSKEEKEQQKTTVTTHKTKKKEIKNAEAYSVDDVRVNHKDAYKLWTPELDKKLTVLFCDGFNLKDMAKHFGRTIGSISSRIKKLELFP